LGNVLFTCLNVFALRLRACRFESAFSFRFAGHYRVPVIPFGVASFRCFALQARSCLLFVIACLFPCVLCHSILVACLTTVIDCWPDVPADRVYCRSLVAPRSPFIHTFHTWTFLYVIICCYLPLQRRLPVPDRGLYIPTRPRPHGDVPRVAGRATRFRFALRATIPQQRGVDAPIRFIYLQRYGCDSTILRSLPGCRYARVPPPSHACGAFAPRILFITRTSPCTSRTVAPHTVVRYHLRSYTVYYLPFAHSRV